MEILKDKHQVARKQHRCDWCSQNIEKGETYRYSFCKDGDAYEWRNHLHCQELASELCWFDEGSLTEDNFWECVSNEFNKLDLDSKRRFSFVEQLDAVLKHHGINKQQLQ